MSHSISFPSSGDFWLKVTALLGEESDADSVFIHVLEEQVNEPVPEGLADGINYINEQTVQLVLYAPLKERVFVMGDFNNWTSRSDGRMAKDGDRFWLTLNNLRPGEEYAYQYQVDGELLHCGSLHGKNPRSQGQGDR